MVGAGDGSNSARALVRAGPHAGWRVVPSAYSTACGVYDYSGTVQHIYTAARYLYGCQVLHTKISESLGWESLIFPNAAKETR